METFEIFDFLVEALGILKYVATTFCNVIGSAVLTGIETEVSEYFKPL